MSLINTSCILQKADSEFYVKYQDSVLEVKRGRLGITLSPGPRVICGTRFLSVSGVLLESVLSFKNKLDKVLAYYPDVPRCSESGHSYDSNLRKSNSLCDHYRDKRVGPIVNSITEV